MYQPLIDKPTPTKQLNWEEAQAYCNFVLFKPQDKILEKYKIIEMSLRTESSINFASHRCLIKSANSLLSIKQFLYDWAPPAWDHPSLWRNAEISSQESTPVPLPSSVGSEIAWVGMNFRRQQAATLSIMRTMIEVTVVEGIAKDGDFFDLFNALNPIDIAVAEQITSTPLAALTYMWRHKRNASPVPVSYWKYARSNQEAYTAHLPQDIAHNSIPEKIFNRYKLNSIFITGACNMPSELEYYYEHTEYSGAYIRLLTIFSNAPFSAKLGDQFCFSENLVIEGHSLGYAYLTEKFGPHEAVWIKDKAYLLLVKPMIWTAGSWFLDNLKTLLRES